MMSKQVVWLLVLIFLHDLLYRGFAGLPRQARTLRRDTKNTRLYAPLKPVNKDFQYIQKRALLVTGQYETRVDLDGSSGQDSSADTNIPRGVTQNDLQADRQVQPHLRAHGSARQHQQEQASEEHLSQQQQHEGYQQPYYTREQPRQAKIEQLNADRLLTFENDPLPNPVQLMDWQYTEPPEELTSSSFLANGSEPGYAAMCVVVRDQHDDILEWIHHHLRLGISTIYVWDNGSEPPLWHLLQKFILQGVVVYNHFTTFEHPTDRPQLYAYDRCLQDYGHKHTWMAFIDADEFLIFRDGPPVQSLPHFLKEFEEYSGLGVHWILFGSSGHVVRPSGGVLRSYHKCLPLQHTQHTLIKTIANTRCTLAAWGPHAFRHNCSQPAVRTNHEPIDGPRSDRPVFERLVLHHYATKSLQDFQAKMARGSGMRRQRGMEYFQFVDAWSVDYNFDAYRVWDDQAEFQHYPSIQSLQGRYNTLPVHDWNS